MLPTLIIIILLIFIKLDFLLSWLDFSFILIHFYFLEYLIFIDLKLLFFST
jgi:hypothetical protein